MRSVRHTQHLLQFTARITETQGNVDFIINIAGSQSFVSHGCNNKHCSTVRRGTFFVVALCILIVFSPLFVQLVHTNYYKIVKL